jgi:uncharacterized protein YbjT (DUF2867 family)
MTGVDDDHVTDGRETIDDGSADSPEASGHHERRVGVRLAHLSILPSAASGGYRCRTVRLRAMRIVVIGGTGFIGAQVVESLRSSGHDPVIAAPSTGVDAFSGDGLAAALAAADAVIDVSDSPTRDPDGMLAFFTASARNIAAAERSAGVGHHVLLSIVGIDRVPNSAYYRAKLAQEEAARSAGPGVPVTVLRATQFATFGRQIADRATIDGRAKVPPVLVQPVSPAEVAAELVRLTVERAPAGTVEIAGPEVVRLDDFMRGTFEILGDPREVETDALSPLMGTDGAPEGALIPVPESGHPLAVGRAVWRDVLAEAASAQAS